MKKTTTLKALVLSMIMTFGLVMPMAAQTDNFFKSNNDDIYENRDGDPTAVNVSGGITNQQFGQTVPVGSGLLIMVAAGASYAVVRRKRVRKGMTLLLAAAMLLGMTQCRKKIENVTPNNDGGVHITLRVENNTKHIITLDGQDVGKVGFEDGDYLWVLNGSQIVGQLFYNSSTEAFSGEIGTDPTHVYGGSTTLDKDDYLYFSYFSGILPELDDDDDDKDVVIHKFSLDIFDQTDQLPVISLGQTAEKYGYYVDNGGLDDLSCELKNKCALVKFTLDNATDKDVALFNVSSSVNLSVEKGKVGITPVTMFKSTIRLYNPTGTSSDVRWAIMLEDGSREADVLIESILYQEAVTIPAIQNNQLIYSEPLNIVTTGSHANVLGAYYNILEGKWLELAKGNLQYNKSTPKYSFMEHQWSTAEADGNVGTLYANQNTVSLFGWGAWGTTLPYNTVEDEYDAVSQQWSTNYAWVNDIDPNLEIDGKTGWRTMTDIEAYLMIAMSDYYSATVNGVHGIIFTPITFTGTITSEKGPGIYSGWENVVAAGADWQALEEAGAAFFPAAGRRRNVIVSNVNPNDYMLGYWTSGKTEFTPTSELPPFVPHVMALFDDGGWQLGVGPLWAAAYGFPVRLVRDVTFTTE